MNRIVDFSIEDVQGLVDTRQLAINKVGIKSMRHPVRVKEQGGLVQHTVAMCNLYVQLPHHCKGTHMSRFVEMLNLNQRDISIESFEAMLREMACRLEANAGLIEIKFPYFVNKRAPVSGVSSLLDYEVTFIGEIRNGECDISIKVLVPVTSLCPCSRQIAAYGAHNQRSHVTVTAKTKQPIWVEEIIGLVESQASSQLYGLLKRSDEKYVTERAYDNPKFVEDIVRDLASQLNADARIGDYTVECENFESIHNHSAYAVIQGQPR